MEEAKSYCRLCRAAFVASEFMAALTARLIPKGCTLPINSILLLRREACCYLTKAQAQRKYLLTNNDCRHLERQECVALHGKQKVFRKFDVVKVALHKHGSSAALQNKREEQRKGMAMMWQRRATWNGAPLPGLANPQHICPDCGMPFDAHY